MRQLPPDTVRLLSSSQVITSVVSVVKELVENSLDAGASNIDIKLENYGLDRIEVRDNGHGVKTVDMAVMAVRHFTSKISSHEDLERLETYGFRGEALGSICAVAQVSVTTKIAEDEFSTQYTLDCTGKIVCQKPSHLGQGTTVSALKLFKNLPVRRQYYSSSKKCKEEIKRVQDVLIAYAIIKPELRLTLTHNKVVVWQKAKCPDHKGALLATLGSNIMANLIPCLHCQEQPEQDLSIMSTRLMIPPVSFTFSRKAAAFCGWKILLEGFLPKPGADQSSTSSASLDKTFLFVNNRPVQHKDILKLLRQHYSAQYTDETARNRYPFAMLKITLCASCVDVNLTPDKTQVLLQNKEAVLTAVEALLISLYGYRPPTEMQLGQGASIVPVPPPEAPSPGLTDQGSCDITAAPDTSLHSSSSSSVAEDWILNQIPGGLESNFSLCGDEMAQTCPPSAESHLAAESPERPADVAGLSEDQFNAENWSKGTALRDSTTGEPLQPVKLHHNTVQTESSANKKMVNIIAEKRAGLTAYDLINNRVMRAPLSPAALFEREARVEVLRENPTASPQDVGGVVHQRWKNLREEDRKKYEERAKKQQENHQLQISLASTTRPAGPERSKPPEQGQKRKALLSNQQLLDELFSAQPLKKPKSPVAAALKQSQPLRCSVATLRLRLQRLSSQTSSAPRGLSLVNRLASQSAWVVLCGRKIMLLNPFRVEEALLFKRLLENNILPAVSLQNPIQLTDGNLGGAEYTETLCSMDKQEEQLIGGSLFFDPRLVANGFKIRIRPGPVLAQRHLEVTAMADCVPFLGVEDLREILTAVLHRKAKSVRECRPLKVTNYLQGEAVRLARQLPTQLTRDDVEDTLLRMEKQLDGTETSCIHGRPFLHHLSDVPSTDDEAQALLRPLNP